REAKEILGGYFREFTFPQWTTTGWTNCECSATHLERGRVFDPFVGSGTTIQVANEMGCHSYGVDLNISNINQNENLAAYIQ
ncbi:MAG: DNA methyltransferase, partial [Halobacteriaceae archaeon]